MENVQCKFQKIKIFTFEKLETEFLMLMFRFRKIMKLNKVHV